MTGGYYLSFQDLGEEVGMLPLALFSFLSQKLDEQNIHLPAPQRPTNFSTPVPSTFQGQFVLSFTGKGVDMQRCFTIYESNTTDASEPLNKVNSKTKHK